MTWWSDFRARCTRAIHAFRADSMISARGGRISIYTDNSGIETENGTYLYVYGCDVTCNRGRGSVVYIRRTVNAGQETDRQRGRRRNQ